jgi:hypothetical protein
VDKLCYPRGRSLFFFNKQVEESFERKKKSDEISGENRGVLEGGFIFLHNTNM